MPTPYAEHVGHQDPVHVLRTSSDAYRALAARLTPAMWRTPWQPGKWTVQQIVLHVTQWEIIFCVRLRCGLGVPNFVVQPYDQDELMKAEEAVVDGPTAFAAFDGLRRMNLALAESLSPAQRKTCFRHAERGEIDVEDVLITMAGHGVHHLKQLEGMGR